MPRWPNRPPTAPSLALHHAPIATPVALMDVLELRGQTELADVVRGRDVRLILGGHLHYPTNGSFAGIPVSVAGATAYTIDASRGAATTPRRRRGPLLHARAPLRRRRGHVRRAGRAGSRSSRASAPSSSPRSRHSRPSSDSSDSPASCRRPDVESSGGERVRPSIPGAGVQVGPVQLDRLLDDYLAHVRIERGYSEHTVAAYRGDLTDLIGFAEQRASTTPTASTSRSCGTGCGPPPSAASRARASRAVRHPRGASPPGWPGAA